MRTQQISFITIITILAMTTITACGTQDTTPAVNSPAKVVDTAKPAPVTTGTKDLKSLLAWVEADCARDIPDSSPRFEEFNNSKAAYLDFIKSPKSSQYSDFVSDVIVEGKQGTLAMGDFRRVTIHLKNATYLGLPITKIMTEEDYESFGEYFYFDKTANISSVKPYLKDSFNSAKINTTDNSIECRPMR